MATCARNGWGTIFKISNYRITISIKIVICKISQAGDHHIKH